MKLWKIGVIAIAVILAVIVAVFASMAFVVFDVMSITATGSETLSPAGDAAGKALVVYDPGVSGSAKAGAARIAADLQAKGYAVDLAGVKSPAAGDASGYDVIVVGGPVYVGNASSSVQAYLRALTPDESAVIGVFSSGGTELSDADAVRREAAPAQSVNSLTIKSTMKLLQTDDTDKKCADFVNALLQ